LAVNSRSLYQLSYRGILIHRDKSIRCTPRAGFIRIILGYYQDFDRFVKTHLFSANIKKMRQH
ncbi:MAG: hypothetical protein ACYSW4_06035, partial [Planctomycetota bacterium]